jgi:hypothetical protein
VTGYCNGVVDFDPGSGVDNQDAAGAFLSKLDSSGIYQWSRTWGSAGGDSGIGFCVAVDQPGNVYVTGSIKGTVDLDPGSGVDNHTANGYDDIFLSKFDMAGDFLWAGTWGDYYNVSLESEEGTGIAIDGEGNVYVTGNCNGNNIDFDPGSGVYAHDAWGAFLSKFDSSGNFKWADAWDEGSTAAGVARDESGNEYVAGYFQKTVDFNPGDGFDVHTSSGGDDAFLMRVDSDGNW